MTKKQELIENQTAELAKFEREEAICELLPEAYRATALVCIHGDHASVKMWSDFRTERKLADAVEIVNQFAEQIQTCEHWKSGCISTRPPQINEYALDECAVMDGSHAVEIVVSGGRNFGHIVELCFWVETSAGLLEISCPVSDLWKLVPRVDANYNRKGDLTTCRIDWPAESRCVDSFRSWWSEKPAYRGSYYLADLPNFMSWAGAILPDAKGAVIA